MTEHISGNPLQFDFSHRPPQYGNMGAESQGMHAAFQATESDAGAGYSARHAAPDTGTANAGSFQQAFEEAKQDLTARQAGVAAEDAAQAEQRGIDATYARQRWGILSQAYHRVKDAGRGVADKVRITIPEGYEGDYGPVGDAIPLSFGQTVRAKLYGGLAAEDIRNPQGDPVRDNPVIRKVYQQGLVDQTHAARQYEERVAAWPRKPGDIDPRQFGSQGIPENKHVYQFKLFKRLLGSTAVRSQL